MADKQLFVISHTHWDREWYSTFQEYRFRLVRLIDKLLDIMENDPAYAYFHFDGQTIMIEDYLQIRPQNEARLYKLIREGRIVIGPWYVMPEEWLCSGESLVANLNRGFDISESIGAKPLMCGYVVDLFGHNPQFPQILRGFGIDNAVLFRGIADYPKNLFNWEAADGSAVTVSRMDGNRCYSNFYFALRYPFEDREFDIDEMHKRLDELIGRMDKEKLCDIYLLMEGCDHVEAEPMLPDLLEQLEEKYDDVKIRLASFEQYMKAIRLANPELETVSGPLYNVGRAHLLHNIVLKNVLSSMVENKQANDRCETKLSRIVEPMDAFLRFISENGDLPANPNETEGREDFIKHAWTYLLKNHPHDSICGCSIPDVHADCDYRFRQSAYIADTLTKNMKELLAGAINTEGKGKDGALILYNPKQTAHKGVAIVELPMPAAHHNNFVFYDQNGKEVPAQIIERANRHESLYNSRQLIRFPLSYVLKAALEVCIPACGYAVFTYDNLLNAAMAPTDYALPEPQHMPHHRSAGSLRISSRRFDTGKIIVEVAANGTLCVQEKSTGKTYEGLLTFEDCGDVGDGWNYVKPFSDREIFSNSARFSIDADGPNAAVIRLVATLDIPADSTAEGRSGSVVPTDITSIITLTRDSGRILVHTTIDNKAVAHRMRVLFPTFIDTEVFYTKTPFNMTKWDIAFPDWETKRETETFVRASQGVSFIGDKTNALALYAKGLYEVAVTDDASHTLALTLFRSFPRVVGGATSSTNLAKTKMDFEYCIDIDSGLTPASALVAGEGYKLDLFAIPSPKHGGNLPAEQSFVNIEEERGAVSLSSFAYRKIGHVLRLCEMSGEKASGKVRLTYNIKSAHYVDLRGNYIGDAPFFDNTVEYTIRPHGIASIALEI